MCAAKIPIAMQKRTKGRIASEGGVKFIGVFTLLLYSHNWPLCCVIFRYYNLPPRVALCPVAWHMTNDYARLCMSSFDHDLRQNLLWLKPILKTPKQTVFWLVISRITLDDGERPLALSLFLFDKRIFDLLQDRVV